MGAGSIKTVNNLVSCQNLRPFLRLAQVLCFVKSYPGSDLGLRLLPFAESKGAFVFDR